MALWFLPTSTWLVTVPVNSDIRRISLIQVILWEFSFDNGRVIINIELESADELSMCFADRYVSVL